MFNSSKVLGVAYAGISLETLAAKAGAGYAKTVDAAGASLEKRYLMLLPVKFSTGTTPHESKKDKTDDKKVVTVSYHTKSGTRYLSIHAHEDGTWKEFLSRSGRSVRPKDDSEEKADSESNK
ncbi:hypothetical protein BDV38DRAFT_278632 [Aspergillus pseudotamarii]|uniref:Uncharacterized protein n=1 Tax=Aspergillus pseudotamarii TaxID=132259 RepID=A0A5N6T6M3_ASPPS|nr:uncharacterized protein BDV38DRAFT_278632 [Aspergillus pseudotamarii]KAE8141851.1 hypothetical protein BDV38DRAFT_278632 [Aspergillus pseudotamarii]